VWLSSVKTLEGNNSSNGREQDFERDDNQTPVEGLCKWPPHHSEGNTRGKPLKEKPENPRTVTMPAFHYVDHSSDITSNDRNYSNVEQQEISKARLSPLASFTSRMSTIAGLRSYLPN